MHTYPPLYVHKTAKGQKCHKELTLDSPYARRCSAGPGYANFLGSASQWLLSNLSTSGGTLSALELNSQCRLQRIPNTVRANGQRLHALARVLYHPATTLNPTDQVPVGLTTKLPQRVPAACLPYHLSLAPSTSVSILKSLPSPSLRAHLASAWMAVGTPARGKPARARSRRPPSRPVRRLVESESAVAAAAWSSSSKLCLLSPASCSSVSTGPCSWAVCSRCTSGELGLGTAAGGGTGPGRTSSARRETRGEGAGGSATDPPPGRQAGNRSASWARFLRTGSSALCERRT